MWNAENPHSKRNRCTKTFLWPSWEGSDFCEPSPLHTCCVLPVSCVSVGLVFPLCLTRTQVFWWRSPPGDRLYCKLPQWLLCFWKFIKTAASLAIFIVGHSKISLVIETLVLLSSASCTCARARWSQSTRVPLWVHLPPLPASQASHGETPHRLVHWRGNRSYKSLLKSYYFVEWLLKRCCFLLSLCKYLFFFFFKFFFVLKF